MASCTSAGRRSEEHTSELQSRGHIVCRLLLEKKNSAQSMARAGDINWPRSPARSAHWTLSLFFFNDTATTEIYTLSLHDALPISPRRASSPPRPRRARARAAPRARGRSEEHTSELQSRGHLVCRLLLEKKKK